MCAGGVTMFRAFLILLCCMFHWPAQAQRADDNAVTAAEDAFGSTLGDESIGLYSSSQVRGFSPVTAGNVRIEGLYFDRQASLPTRLVPGSTVHVGLSAQGYPFPAPTGIVDYRLHKAGDERIISVAASLDPYVSPSLEIDAKIPLIAERLGVAAGISYAHEEYYDGADARYWRAAVIPCWRPTRHIEVVPFWSLSLGRDEEVAPTVITGGSWLPPQIERRRYFGQPWADNETDNTNFGLLAKARVGADWAIAGGIFRSIADTSSGFAELYAGTQIDGLTRELIIADPRQHYTSTSGELRVSRSFVDGPRLHIVHVSMRAREQNSLYGGSAPTIDLGLRPLGQRIVVAEPEQFDFGQRIRDEVRQWTAGVAYEGRWRGVGEASLGLQRTNYEKRIDQPGLPQVGTRDEPWLASAAIAGYLSSGLALYAGYTRGLEESGIAPDSAANRNQALPAIRTKQMDAGVRWAVTPQLKLVAGAFEVEKPYFTTDELGIYTTLGQVRHRGVEFSLAGTVLDNFSVVAGALLMKPEVAGEAVELGRVGKRPVGQTDRVLRLNLDYRPPAIAALSLDMAVWSAGCLKRRPRSCARLHDGRPGCALSDELRQCTRHLAVASGEPHRRVCLVGFQQQQFRTHRRPSLLGGCLCRFLKQLRRSYSAGGSSHESTIIAGRRRGIDGRRRAVERQVGCRSNGCGRRGQRITRGSRGG